MPGVGGFSLCLVDSSTLDWGNDMENLREGANAFEISD